MEGGGAGGSASPTRLSPCPSPPRSASPPVPVVADRAALVAALAHLESQASILGAATVAAASAPLRETLRLLDEAAAAGQPASAGVGDVPDSSNPAPLEPTEPSPADFSHEVALRKESILLHTYAQLPGAPSLALPALPRTCFGVVRSQMNKLVRAYVEHQQLAFGDGTTSAGTAGAQLMPRLGLLTRLHAAFAAGRSPEIAQHGPQVAASLLRRWLLSLRAPLITQPRLFLRCNAVPDPAERSVVLALACQLLPHNHRMLLQPLVELLRSYVLGCAGASPDTASAAALDESLVLQTVAPLAPAILFPPSAGDRESISRPGGNGGSVSPRSSARKDGAVVELDVAVPALSISSKRVRVSRLLSVRQCMRQVAVAVNLDVDDVLKGFALYVPPPSDTVLSLDATLEQCGLGTGDQVVLRLLGDRASPPQHLIAATRLLCSLVMADDLFEPVDEARRLAAVRTQACRGVMASIDDALEGGAGNGLYDPAAATRFPPLFGEDGGTRAGGLGGSESGAAPSPSISTKREVATDRLTRRFPHVPPDAIGKALTEANDNLVVARNILMELFDGTGGAPPAELASGSSSPRQADSQYQPVRQRAGTNQSASSKLSQLLAQTAQTHKPSDLTDLYAVIPDAPTAKQHVDGGGGGKGGLLRRSRSTSAAKRATFSGNTAELSPSLSGPAVPAFQHFPLAQSPQQTPVATLSSPGRIVKQVFYGQPNLYTTVMVTPETTAGKLVASFCRKMGVTDQSQCCLFMSLNGGPLVPLHPNETLHQRFGHSEAAVASADLSFRTPLTEILPQFTAESSLSGIPVENFAAAAELENRLRRSFSATAVVGRTREHTPAATGAAAGDASPIASPRGTPRSAAHAVGKHSRRLFNKVKGKLSRSNSTTAGESDDAAAGGALTSSEGQYALIPARLGASGAAGGAGAAQDTTDAVYMAAPHRNAGPSEAANQLYTNPGLMSSLANAAGVPLAEPENQTYQNITLAQKSKLTDATNDDNIYSPAQHMGERGEEHQEIYSPAQHNFQHNRVVHAHAQDATASADSSSESGSTRSQRAVDAPIMRLTRSDTNGAATSPLKAGETTQPSNQSMDLEDDDGNKLDREDAADEHREGVSSFTESSSERSAAGSSFYTDESSSRTSSQARKSIVNYHVTPTQPAGNAGSNVRGAEGTGRGGGRGRGSGIDGRGGGSGIGGRGAGRRGGGGLVGRQASPFLAAAGLGAGPARRPTPPVNLGGGNLPADTSDRQSTSSLSEPGNSAKSPGTSPRRSYYGPGPTDPRASAAPGPGTGGPPGMSPPAVRRNPLAAGGARGAFRRGQMGPGRPGRWNSAPNIHSGRGVPRGAMRGPGRAASPGGGATGSAGRQQAPMALYRKHT